MTVTPALCITALAAFILICIIIYILAQGAGGETSIEDMADDLRDDDD